MFGAGVIESGWKRIGAKGTEESPAANTNLPKAQSPQANQDSLKTTGRTQPQPVAFNDVQSPGAYVACELGFLVRVPADAIAPSRRVGVTITAEHPLKLWKLCDNPWVPLGTARQLASDQDMPVAF
jgi:hypothetical protein